MYEAFSKVNYLKNRTPETTEAESKDAFLLLSEYRNGGIYIAHYCGSSEWERHPNGDEIVQVIEGETVLVLLEKNQQIVHTLITGQLFVVPKGIWHRFESPKGVKVMTVTPLPTEHRVEVPVTT